jgi:hypothetical protein
LEERLSTFQSFSKWKWFFELEKENVWFQYGSLSIGFMASPLLLVMAEGRTSGNYKSFYAKHFGDSMQWEDRFVENGRD